MEKNYILTSCGLSLLTNGLSKNFKEQYTIYSYSNHAKSEEIKDEAFLKAFDEEYKTLKSNLKRCSENELKKLSAELNALINFYDGNFNKHDIHRLFYTNTYLGEKTAELIKEILLSKGLNVSLYKAKDLRTSDLEEFNIALSDVVKDLSNEISQYRDDGYKIVFNLTGGYKSVNSFLAVMASLYADESIYIFEKSDELLRIPRLPVRIDESVFENNVNIFRSLEIGIKTQVPENLPKTLIIEMDGEFAISPWGEIVWQKVKRDIYKMALVEPLSEKWKYSDNFRKDFEKLSVREKYKLNETLDKLELFLNKGKNLRSLRFHPVKGMENWFELYPFEGNDSRRAFCEKVEDAIILKRIGNHLK